MNWTGGRLNRHARSHASGSDKIRAQRTFFAQAARNRRDPKISSHFPAKAIMPIQSKYCLLPETHIQEHTKPVLTCHLHLAQPSPRLEQHFQRDAEISHLRPDLQESFPRSQVLTAKSLDGSKVDFEASETNSHLRNARETAPAYEMSNSISEMKKKLLNQSDWLGLSACRPANIDFAPPGDMAKIGRHRRSTQLKDQDNRNQPTNENSPQYITRALIGKRKRPDQEEHPSHLDVGQCGFGSASQEQAEHPPSRRPLEDPNRRFYVLGDAEAYLGINPKGLISLEEARGFHNFDAVRERHLESKIKRDTAKDRDHSKTKDACREPQMAHSAHQNGFSNFDINRSEFATRESSPKSILSSPVSLIGKSTPLKDRRNHLPRRSHLTSAQDANASQPAAPVVLSEKAQARILSDVPTPTLQQAGIAVQDFAIVTASLKGKHKLYVADRDDTDHAIGYTWLKTPTQTPKEISLTSSSTEIINANKSAAQTLFKAYHSQKDFPRIGPQVKFQLDEIFELESESVPKPGHDALLEEPRKDVERTLLSDAILSPHFLRMIESGKITQQENPVPLSRMSCSAHHEETESAEPGLTESIMQGQHHELGERSFTKTFLDSQPVGHHSAAILQPELYAISPAPERLRRPSRACEQMCSSTSSSSLLLDHGRSPTAVFSRNME